MGAHKLKPLSQQDLETAIKKLLKDQEEYHAEWLRAWAAQIGRREVSSPERHRRASKRAAA